MMTLTLILSFFACADHSAPSTGGATCEAEPGRVRDIESGKSYDSLDEVDWTDGKSHHLCLGQGKHVVEGPLLALNSEDPEPPEISLQGAGPLTTRIVPLDPEGLLRTVRGHGISMCGVVPTTVALFAARALGASEAELVRYGNSGERSGDYDRVVGYAGVLVR